MVSDKDLVSGVKEEVRFTTFDPHWFVLVKRLIQDGFTPEGARTLAQRPINSSSVMLVRRRRKAAVLRMFKKAQGSGWRPLWKQIHIDIKRVPAERILEWYDADNPSEVAQAWIETVEEVEAIRLKKLFITSSYGDYLMQYYLGLPRRMSETAALRYAEEHKEKRGLLYERMQRRTVRRREIARVKRALKKKKEQEDERRS